MHAYKVDVAKSMLEVCGRLGGRLLLVEATTSTHADADPERIVRDLRMLATLAIPMGIRIAYKGMAWSRTTKDFAAAGDLVFRANCPNLGVAIDAFDVIAAHISREELDAIDPQQIYLVQLSDYMWQEIRSTEEQAATATHFRVFPGEGAHSDGLADFITKLDAIGYCGNYSFDVYNDDYLQMPPETVAAGRNARPNGSAKPCCGGAADTEHGAPAARRPRVRQRDARSGRTAAHRRTVERNEHGIPAAGRLRTRGFSDLPRDDDVRRPHRCDRGAADRR
jgi:sugar phosphate isomerase/epimerase